MWTDLEENWTHFYWLTGEIPPTLELLTTQVEPLLKTRGRGRKCKLSLKNQVM